MKMPERESLPDRVEVFWIDCSGSHGWKSMARKIPTPCNIMTQGYLIKEEEHWIAVAESLDYHEEEDEDLGNYGCISTIPRIAIKSIEVWPRKTRRSK